MQLTTTWQKKYRLESTDGANAVAMDIKAPHGDGAALSPKQLCLAGLVGCTGMDVISHLNKHKQAFDSLRIEADAPVREKAPAIFTSVTLDFFLTGGAETAKVVDAVRLSQTKYCGVSAMIAKACPIFYRVHLNGALVSEGQADFGA